MTTAVVRVPVDTAARSVGADEVAAAIEHQTATRGIDVSVVRTSSRGALWLEPLVEVLTVDGPMAYGPLEVADVRALLDTGWPHERAPEHPRALGPVADIDWLARQDRLLFARAGETEPLSTLDYETHGGLSGLRRAVTMTPADVVEEVSRSGLRGRGGAGFPAGIKWQTVLDAPGTPKFVCANADEGDSGTFADRMVMEGDPYLLLEGMAIAGLAVGATEGYVYIRSEYPAAVVTMREAVARARDAGWIGPDVLGSGRAFDVEVRVGAGAYICGEETAMLESIEGKRGVVRAKPPLPAVEGLFGLPTIVNNVLTLAAVPSILADGADAYAARGADRSRGTQVFQLAGNVARGGIVEVPFGITLRELIEGYGGGTASGRPIGAVQVGGPLGAYLSTGQLDVPLDYESLAGIGGLLGHGGVVVFDDRVDMAHQARFAMEFCAEESCGKCTPCRIGAVRGVETIDRIIAGVEREQNLVLLEELCEVMTDGSLCAMGGLTPLPVRSALEHFRADFHPAANGAEA
jgi:formate dehydrogenase iron-sulfur subunit